MDAQTAAAPRESFLAAVRQALLRRTFESLVLAKPRGAAADLKSVRLRTIDLRGQPAISFAFMHATRDETRNFSVDDGLEQLAALLDHGATPSFGHAVLQSGDGDVQLLIGARGRATMRRLRRPASAVTTAIEPPTAAMPHDRVRARRLDLGLPFLVELGITDAQHRLVPAMARKWRQIDKFLEVIDDALAAVPGAVAPQPDTPLRVVDFGAGKGYLTFAVYEHLLQRLGRPPQVTGVELRPELVDFCNGVAERCGYAGLRFVAGDLRSYQPPAVDVMIALHACDTATDHALDLGLRAGAGILVCSPCCHKELRPQMGSPRALAGVLRHGIHRGQEAEMLTDSLRALLLEASGYQAKVFEFVSLEHTGKNKMILATRRPAADVDPGRALAEVAEVKDFYGIREQCLETLLRRRGLLTTPVLN